MLLYPEVSNIRLASALGGGILGACAVGAALYSLLARSGKRSRLSRVIVNFWSVSVGTMAGWSVAFAIGGPYLMAGQRHDGSWDTDPATLGPAVFASACTGAMVAFATWRYQREEWSRLRRAVALGREFRAAYETPDDHPGRADDDPTAGRHAS